MPELKSGVQFVEDLFEVFAVSVGRLFDGFAVSECATEAVHSVSEQYFGSVRIDFEKVCDKRVFGYFFHNNITPYDEIFVKSFLKASDSM